MSRGTLSAFPHFPDLSRHDLTAINLLKCEVSSNSFTLGLKLSDKDFVSLDESELTQLRQPDDGRLPVIRFLQPAEGSTWIESLRRSN